MGEDDEGRTDAGYFYYLSQGGRVGWSFTIASPDKRTELHIYTPSHRRKVKGGVEVTAVHQGAEKEPEPIEVPNVVSTTQPRYDRLTPMGTWGSGTFENDTALDALGDLVDRLERQITRSLKAADRDGEYERPIIALVACLRALAAAFEEVRPWLRRSEVEAWQATYFAWFDRTSPKMGAEPEFVNALRANDNDEFEKLKSYLGAS
ncbi:MAG TPA: DUF4259 domain-containing protein [Pirellulales bacterium]|nr:DUF4259 domain-containing protein [Pirellulales bacterium]